MHTINLSGREVAEAGLTRRLKLAEEASIKIDVIDLVDDEEEQATRPHRPPEDRRSDDSRDATNPTSAPRLTPFHGVLSANDDGKVLFMNGSLSGERRTYSRRPIHASPDSTSSSSERARERRADHPFKPSPSSTHSKASAGSCIIFNRSYVKTPMSSSTTSGISPTRYNVFDRAPTTDRSSQLIRNAFQRAGSRPPMLSGSSDTTTSIHGSPTIDITGHRGSESPLPRVSLLRRSYHKSSGESATSTSSHHHPVVATIDLDSDCSPVRSSNHQTTVPEEVDDSSSSSESATASKLPRQPSLARDEKMEVAEDPAVVAFVGIDLDSIDARSAEKLRDPTVDSHPTDHQTTEDEPDQQEDDEGSSMENSYGDVSSSGCVKYSSTRHSMGRQGVTEASRSNSMNEFELKLQEINEWVKPMTHRDRVEHWRVTEEDLRHSIPTKAKIETTSCSGTKRTFYDTVHISSEDDSSDDSPIEGIPSTMGGSMLTTKKRRTADAMEASTSTSELRSGVMNGLATDRTACAGTSAPTTLSQDDGEDSDFRNGQLNPDIDKPQAGISMLLIKRAYHKLPSRNRLCKRCNKCSPTEVNGGVPVPGIQTYCDCRRAIETPNKGPNGTPYAQLLCRDRGLDSFLHYLRISPLHRTNQIATAPPPPPPSSDDVRAMGVILAPGSKVEQDAQSVTKSAHGIGRTTKSKSRTQRKANKEKRRVIKSKKKVTAKSKSHPGTIASSAIRGVRRLVLSSSLRSGKVIRYRTTFPSLRQPPRQGKCTPRITAAMVNHEAPTDAHDAPSITESKPVPRINEPGDASDGGATLPAQQQLDSPVHSPPMASSSSSSSSSSMTQKPKPKSLHRTAAAASLRCSVDSAVSSSTSAEMHEGKRSKECQTVESALALEAVAAVECPADPPPKPVNEGIPCRNPVSRNDGEVLHVFLLDEKLIVVQTGLVSFWRYSRLSALLGVRQEWERVAQVSRWLRDTELDTENAHRIGYNNCHPFYLEPRARNLTEDESRTCPLASIYVNAYFLITKIHMLTSGAPSGDEGGEQDNVETSVDDGTAGPAPEDQGTVREEDVARVKSYQLDTVKSTLEDVLFLPIPNTRYFIVCWYEHVREMESKTGLCKYSLTPDLETLASIREFLSVRQKLNSLRCLPNSRLLGLGESTVHLWCYETGHLLWTIDLKLSLGTIVGSFVHREMVESTLFLLQLQPVVNESNRKLMKVIAVNLYKKAWYVAHSYEVALSSMRITGESQLAEPTEAGNQRHCVTFQSGEMLLVSLNTPSFCWTNHKRLAKDLQHAEECSVLVCSRLRSNTGDVYRPKERIQNAGYWHGGRDLLLLGDQCLTIKSIDEYMAESAR
ncbi:uncharacterized protein LOC126580969 [Anopheles aquasalis]|uniref:uncharacterized protein LOC126580969 n=1 Tax=Anopheles aquasalis TaxID=42839 RepID=UPI00215AF761|nr:uncharacterized protein LOC126580969 [Anopheles aquasalis]XP_050100297.1 uncharacterized protein LOC126580969 [Anopheles aquasalis]